MSQHSVDIAIVGAGPYGLSLAAHLKKYDISFRIFGKPMSSWRDHMPKGMFLKSEHFASDLYDPDSAFTLRHYCAENGLPYQDTGNPVPVQKFVDYGLAFQRECVSELEPVLVNRISRLSDGFELATSTGEKLRARRVVIATGIAHFAFLPPALRGHSSEFVSHSFHHNDLSRYTGQRVAVVGGGSSAVDVAALLAASGANVTLITRRKSLAFHEPALEPRPLFQRLKQPRSGLGLGWRSWLCSNLPSMFHALPESFRLRVVKKHLGPAPGWFMKQQVEGKFPIVSEAAVTNVFVDGSEVQVSVKRGNGQSQSFTVDHVIGATGYKVDIDRLKFLDDDIRRSIRRTDGSPALDRNFQCSVPGLYMTGLASAASFGPLTRFACGASFASRRLAPHLASGFKRRSAEALASQQLAETTEARRTSQIA